MREKLGDYRLKLTVKNDRLLMAIEGAGFNSISKAAIAIGIGYRNLNDYISLKSSPIDKSGEVRETALKISEFLGKMVSDLWSREQMEPLETNTAEASVTAEELAVIRGSVGNWAEQIGAVDPLRLIDRKELTSRLEKTMDGLNKRQRYVLTGRMGWDGPVKTLKALAAELGVTGSYVREIEAKALRYMRHPKNRNFSVEDL